MGLTAQVKAMQLGKSRSRQGSILQAITVAQAEAGQGCEQGQAWQAVPWQVHNVAAAMHIQVFQLLQTCSRAAAWHEP